MVLGKKTVNKVEFFVLGIFEFKLTCTSWVVRMDFIGVFECVRPKLFRHLNTRTA